MLAVGRAACAHDVTERRARPQIAEPDAIQAVQDARNAHADLGGGLDKIDLLVAGGLSALLHVLPDELAMVHLHPRQRLDVESVHFGTGQINPVDAWDGRMDAQSLGVGAFLDFALIDAVQIANA